MTYQPDNIASTFNKNIFHQKTPLSSYHKKNYQKHMPSKPDNDNTFITFHLSSKQPSSNNLLQSHNLSQSKRPKHSTRKLPLADNQKETQQTVPTTENSS
jgi:hypothetical protein